MHAKTACCDKQKKNTQLQAITSPGLKSISKYITRAEGRHKQMRNAECNDRFAATIPTRKLCQKRVRTRAATQQLVIREDQRKRNNKCVLTSGGVSCAMTITRLALHPREHARTQDIVDDRVQEEGALRQLLVPPRVHEGGVHAPVKELLVEQDAAAEFHCGSIQLGCFDNQLATVVQCFPSFCINHQCLSSVMLKKKTEITNYPK